MMTDDDKLLSISGIQHFVYCRRQWALIHIEQQWEENVLTVSGELMHQNAHDSRSTEKRGNLLVSRGMAVTSRALGLTGVCDVVEFHKSDEGALLHGQEGYYRIVPQIGLLYTEIENINTQIRSYSELIAANQEELDTAEAKLAELNEKN
ncbi:MAG: Dna2/Cas4 domain-containing protein, partial [Ruminococcus sp.]|nr:Dna2/Cas4 domain-containing protein [Ruminococcus sp.]